ncbi:unknow (plasmid) [Vibrio parahaemolyticus]|nr:unknow [Vibrio parahaemolyticus]
MLNSLFIRSTTTLITLLSNVLTKPLQKQTNVLRMQQSAKPESIQEQDKAFEQPKKMRSKRMRTYKSS